MYVDAFCLYVAVHRYDRPAFFRNNRPAECANATKQQLVIMHRLSPRALRFSQWRKETRPLWSAGVSGVVTIGFSCTSTSSHRAGQSTDTKSQLEGVFCFLSAQARKGHVGWCQIVHCHSKRDIQCEDQAAPRREVLCHENCYLPVQQILGCSAFQ